ncbi:right-handed parallel beta-helix repeat-containing protein [Candidatus Eisenbacteria bacterium]|uniref:Right-handed parallel beta-helix repeat-containing protein n=1 Tax=Eiseniibacteriota bacterium TaxID=2212470 RepID=A0ABV6YQ62_UNCEI
MTALLVGCSEDCPTCNVPDEPSAPCDPSPADGASGVLDGIVLSWGCGDCECGLKVTYDVHFGPDSEPPLISRDFELKRYSPGPLEPGTHYYWKIVAKNSAGSTAGPVWDFETEPAACTKSPTLPCNPSPANAAVAVAVDTDLIWECGESSCELKVTYDVYFGRGFPAPPLVCDGCSTRTYDPGMLDHDSRYFWKVVASDSAGSTTGPMWDFWTEEAACTDGPTTPHSPFPADRTSDLPLDGVLLTWEGGDSQCGLPVTYDIYFGEESVGDQLVCSDCTTKFYDPGPLNRSRVYVWGVVPRDANGEALGRWWVFKTTAGELRSWYIKPDGTGDVPTIQAGVDSAADGDTLILADGFYEGTGNREILIVARNLTIRSESGDPEACIIDCRSTGHNGFHFSMCNGLIDGLTLIGTTTAIVARLGASVQVNNCNIDRCVDRAVVVVGRLGGAYSSVSLSSCVFMENWAGVSYVANKAGLSATKCLFGSNEHLVDLGEQATVRLDRCTIAYNHGGTAGLIRSCGPCFSDAEIRQCIFASNSGVLVGIVPTFQCNDVYGNTDGDYVGLLEGMNGIDGNFSLDPRFCGLDSGGVKLRPDSPCAEGNHPDGADCGQIGAFPAGCNPGSP